MTGDIDTAETILLRKDKKPLSKYVKLCKKALFVAAAEGYYKPTYACKVTTPEKTTFATL